MKILAIETSCDDTGVAILEVPASAKGSGVAKKGKFKVLSNIVSSQQIHANYGGVFPMMAKREHQVNLVPVLTQALKQAKLLKNKSLTKSTAVKNVRQMGIIEKILEKENTLFESVKSFLEKYEKPNIDYIAVTHGPGLEPCLWVGVNFAKALSYFWDIPVIPVNHIEAHIAVNFLPKINGNSKSEILNPKTTFPAIALIVSGGHTQLILMKKIGDYEIIGETRDDAAGECFDKAARILHLGYPGGPRISALAGVAKMTILLNALIPGDSSEPLPQAIHLPRPMMHTKDYDFSFSGLKTAVLYMVRDKLKDSPKDQEDLDSDFVGQMCIAIEEAICDVLIKKTLNAAKDFKVKTIILGGGVSANSELREQFRLKVKGEGLKVKIIVPDPKLSTDNGLMIAVAGYFNKAKKIAWQKLSVNANLRVSK